jgi:hypothetical protein
VTTLRLACEQTSRDFEFYGGIHRIVYQDYHRLLGKVFPYGIFYTMEGDCAVVWAVIDLRNDPEWIRRKLTK